jgi:hypothetical protein
MWFVAMAWAAEPTDPSVVVGRFEMNSTCGDSAPRRRAVEPDPQIRLVFFSERRFQVLRRSPCSECVDPSLLGQGVRMDHVSGRPSLGRLLDLTPGFADGTRGGRDPWVTVDGVPMRSLLD